MLPPQLEQSRGSAKILRQRAHVRTVVNAVLDPGALAGEEVIVGCLSRDRHFVEDESCPPHGLLFGDGWNGTNAWTDETYESDGGI